MAENSEKERFKNWSLQQKATSAVFLKVLYGKHSLSCCLPCVTFRCLAHCSLTFCLKKQKKSCKIYLHFLYLFPLGWWYLAHVATLDSVLPLASKSKSVDEQYFRRNLKAPHFCLCISEVYIQLPSMRHFSLPK